MIKIPAPWVEWLRTRTPIRPEDFVGADPTRNEQAVRSGFATAAKQYLRRLPIASEVTALYFCMLDRQTPTWVKAAAAAALAYFVLPIDLVPDVLVGIGLVDDLSVLSAALAALSGYITAEHRRQARAWLHDEQILLDVTPHDPA